MRELVIATLVAGVVISGCNKQSDDTSNTQTQPPKVEIVQPPKPPFDAAMWKTAFRSTFEERSLKASDDGTAEYGACFKSPEQEKCNFFFGKRDGFRKIDHLISPNTSLNNIANLYTNIRIYISAKECNQPNILIEPVVNKKGGWIFMEKVAFMVDGDVVLEKSFEHTAVDRDQDYPAIRERATFIADQSEIEALRKFVSGKNHIIRITGKNSYMTVEKQRTADFVSDAQSTLTATDKINDALRAVGGPSCTS
jgi:hypothetical protein